MAAETKTRGRVWEHQETLLLLEKWGDDNIQLQLDSCTRKKPIWLEIAAYLRAAGYEDRDDCSCKTRIHTLISAYRSYKDECSKTGNATPKKKPAFFDEVDELLSDKPCTKPKVIIKSATISIDGDNDAAKARAENVEPNVNIPRLLVVGLFSKGRRALLYRELCEPPGGMDGKGLGRDEKKPLLSRHNLPVSRLKP